MFLAAFKSRLMGTLGLQWSHTFSLPAVPGHTYGGGVGRHGSGSSLHFKLEESVGVSSRARGWVERETCLFDTCRTR